MGDVRVRTLPTTKSTWMTKMKDWSELRCDKNAISCLLTELFYP
jgi:hypothetical protein